MDDDSAGWALSARLLAVLLPPVPGDVFTTADALRHGVTQRQLEWAVRTGVLHRLQLGAFCRSEQWAAADPGARAVLAARAVGLSRRVPGPYAFSHGTAAAVLGLQVSEALAAHVWLTVPRGGSTRRSGTVIQQVAPLPADEVRVIAGLPCTTATRTVVDCLRHLPTQEAVVLGDAALRAGHVTAAQLAALLERRRWPRAAAASALLPLLDGQRESGLESRSAVVMHEYDLPAPETQVRILDQGGRVVARADFLWRRHGVVGEADGLVKYGDDAARRIAEEKRREARLQALGLVVVRWTAAHLHGDPPLLVQQLRAALAQGNPDRFRGRVA